MTATTEQDQARPVQPRGASTGWWYVGAVVVGSALVVWAAINQPFNQNELRQIAPYGSDSVEEITSGTRQPPLGPLLGAGFQHLLGEGQLQQRMVPVLSGIGVLVVTALLLRRLGLGAAGAFGMWVLATAPVFLRYSAYTRPYMLPLLLMMLFVYAGHRWLEERRGGWLWLAVAAAAAAALPLARVPEPIIFLGVSIVVLGWLGLRGHVAWTRAGPLAAVTAAAVVLVGYPLYAKLASEAESIYDPTPSGIASRFGKGVYELRTFWLSQLGDWFPWWPVTLLVLVTALALPASRRRLARWWFLWPLLAAPVVFVLAYHFVNTYSLDARTYRPRMLTFFLPGYVLVVVALAAVTSRSSEYSRLLRAGIGVLLAAALVLQLPTAGRVLTQNYVADFGQVGEVLTEDIPDNAIVLYDVPSPVGRWRQPFSARPKYMGDTPYVGVTARLQRRARQVPERGPVFVLMLDSECSYSVACDAPPQGWDKDVPGWHIRKRLDKFILYEPDTPLGGRAGAIAALRAFGRDMGPDLGHPETFAAARLLKLEGRPGQGKALIEQMYSQAGAKLEERIRRKATSKDLDAFR